MEARIDSRSELELVKGKLDGLDRKLESVNVWLESAEKGMETMGEYLKDLQEMLLN